MVLKGVSHMVEVDIHVNDRLVHTPEVMGSSLLRPPAHRFIGGAGALSWCPMSVLRR